MATDKRLLGMHIQEGRGVDYGTAFSLARSVGVRVIPLSLNWTDIETRPGVYANPFIAVANSFYPPRKTGLHLILRPINTVRREVPADLRMTSWDAPPMIDRFAALLDYVLEGLRDTDLVTIALGNEVDAVLDTERSWEAYRTFFERARDRVHKKRPGVPVGVTRNVRDLTNDRSHPAVDLNTVADAVLVTYYPLHSDFTVRPPKSPESDFADLVRRYPAKPIHFLEAGYPSGAACRSSEAMQAQFVESLFRAWDRYADRIPSIALAWQADCTPAEVALFLRYYGAGNPAFQEYLTTLGLRTNTNHDKAAWTALRRATKARGWGSA